MATSRPRVLENRADQIAPEVGAYVREVLDSDDVLSLVRVVQSMMTHLGKFPVERGACTRVAAREREDVHLA
jgi:hypothetical protein